MNTCKQTTDMVTAYLERALPWHTRLSIWLHIQMCGPCRRYFRQIEQVAKATGRIPPLEMPPEVADSLSSVLADAAPASPPEDA